MVTDAQVKRLRKKLMEAKTMEAAAMAAGMSERSARTWKTGALPSQTKVARDWRTRADPFAEVWTSDVVPLLEADVKGVLEAKTVIDVLAEKYTGKYSESQTRTLQRRMREWRALGGHVVDLENATALKVSETKTDRGRVIGWVIEGATSNTFKEAKRLFTRGVALLRWRLALRAIQNSHEEGGES
jgi:hypothetical protein